MYKQIITLLTAMVLLSGCLGSMAKTEPLQPEPVNVNAAHTDQALLYVMEKRIQQRRLDRALALWEAEKDPQCKTNKESKPVAQEEFTCKEVMQLTKKICNLPEEAKFITYEDPVKTVYPQKGEDIMALEEERY